jgi:glycosyltransferase involved in cell wall biosynthesis
VKVLHILNELMPSGAEVGLRVAAPHWRALGLECHILSTGKCLGVYSEKLLQAGYILHNLTFAKAPGFFIKLYTLLKENRFHIVHIHTERANFYYALTARAAGIRNIVRTIHNVFIFPGRTTFVRLVQRRLLRQMNVKQVSIGHSVAENELRRYRNPTCRISNWCSDNFRPVTDVEARALLRSKLQIETDVLVVVSVGNCSIVKNHEQLIHALAMIKERHNLFYIHIGMEEDGGPERRLAQKLGIAEHIRFLGFIEDPLPYLQVADVYVMPSLYEGIGISALEAMASGAPIVLTDVPGLRDIKMYSDAPVWVAPSAEAISAGIDRIAMLTPKQRIELGLTGHAIIQKHFGVVRGVKAYAALYQNSKWDIRC